MKLSPNGSCAQNALDANNCWKLIATYICCAVQVMLWRLRTVLRAVNSFSVYLMPIFLSLCAIIIKIKSEILTFHIKKYLWFFNIPNLVFSFVFGECCAKINFHLLNIYMTLIEDSLCSGPIDIIYYSLPAA